MLVMAKTNETEKGKEILVATRAAAETVMVVLLLIGARMDRAAVMRVMMIEKE